MSSEQDKDLMAKIIFGGDLITHIYIYIYIYIKI